MEVHVNRFQLSPVARLLVSFSLVISILVAGQTHPLSPRTVAAQTAESSDIPVSVGIGMILPISRGSVVGSSITASGLLIDGVPTDVILPGRVQILDSVVVSGTFMSVYSVVVSGNAPEQPKDSVVVSGNVEEDPEPGAAVVATEVETQEVVVSSSEGAVQLSGGQLRGTDIRVVNGVVEGNNLTVVGATVSGSNISVSGVLVTVPGY